VEGLAEVMTCEPRSPATPFALLRRTFQSKATFSAFSTPERPALDEEGVLHGGRDGQAAMVSTNCAYSTL
jgi:hypothetical protein